MRNDDPWVMIQRINETRYLTRIEIVSNSQHKKFKDKIKF